MAVMPAGIIMLFMDVTDIAVRGARCMCAGQQQGQDGIRDIRDPGMGGHEAVGFQIHTTHFTCCFIPYSSRVQFM